LAGGIDIHVPIIGHIRIPTFRLVRFELDVLYDEVGGVLYPHTAFTQTDLGAGWVMDSSSSGTKEGGGAFGTATFEAGGLNPFQVFGYDAEIRLSQATIGVNGVWSVTGDSDVNVSPNPSVLGGRLDALSIQKQFSCQTLN
jgi:hypothetical protein